MESKRTVTAANLVLCVVLFRSPGYAMIQHVPQATTYNPGLHSILLSYDPADSLKPGYRHGSFRGIE